MMEPLRKLGGSLGSRLPRVEVFDSTTGQWRLETGVGRLRSFQPNGPRYVEVTIDAPPLANAVTGWADRGAEPFTTLFAHGLGNAAIELHDVDVEYRVEVRRRQDVDRSIPLEDLEPHQKRRRMVHLAIASPGDAVDVAPTPEPSEPVDESATHERLRRLAHDVAAAPPASGPDEWDISQLDLTDTAAVPHDGLNWDRYRVGLRRHFEQRSAARAADPAAIATDDQVLASLHSWLASLGLDADERTVFTLIAALAFLQSGLIMRGHLCMPTAHELDLLIGVFSLLVPSWVVVDA